MNAMTTDENIVFGDIPNFNDQSFRKKFWEWFDALPRTERKKFQEYPADMAEMYFYNKYYSKGLFKQTKKD